MDKTVGIASAFTSLVGAFGLLVTGSVSVLGTVNININLEVVMFAHAIVMVGLALLGSV